MRVAHAWMVGTECRLLDLECVVLIAHGLKRPASRLDVAADAPDDPDVCR